MSALARAHVNRRQLGAWAGMLGSALFVLVFLIEGWLRPGFDARRMFVSELSLGPRGGIQIANFVVTGALLLVFTQGVAAEFPAGKASRFGPILLAIISISLLVSGPFVTDPVSLTGAQMSQHGRLHSLFGALVFSLSPVSCVVFWRRFREDPAWQSLHWWTLAVAAITTASIVVMSAGPTQPPEPPNAFNAWIGLVQRAFLIAYMSWIFTFALTLQKRDRGTSHLLQA
jgi:hypothetical protein